MWSTPIFRGTNVAKNRYTHLSDNSNVELSINGGTGVVLSKLNKLQTVFVLQFVCFLLHAQSQACLV